MKFDTSHDAFPDLSDDEMRCIAELGTLRHVADGEPLFQIGDRDYSFFVVKSGEIAISESSAGVDRKVGVHGARAFTGDVSMLTGRPAMVDAFAQGPTQVYEVTACRIRMLLAEMPSISDKLLQAFQVRRKLLEQSEFMGIRVVGAADCKDTLLIREFYYKNAVPHTFLDVETLEGKAALAEFD
ncbi:MAG: cyclic nucleotide-binding domain-containing protein, partial [Planctomycetota bacterium]